MIRTLRNLSALAFLLAVFAIPPATMEAQGDFCATIRYRCNGENVDFSGCEQGCSELWSRCSSYCSSGNVYDFYCSDSGASRSGYCDCQQPCFEG